MIDLKQTGETSSSLTTATLLVFPCTDRSIMFEQLEDHSQHHPDRPTTHVVIMAKSYRNHLGQVRVDSHVRDTSNSDIATSVLIDSVKGVQTILLHNQHIAYQLPFMFSEEGSFVSADAADGSELSDHHWNTYSEDLGKTQIENVTFEGVRIVSACVEDSILTTTFERWYSRDMKLVGSIERIGPYKGYSIRIRNLEYKEPESLLFEIPSGFDILDVNLP
ncbi:MAG TPA: hypothetical protein VK638_30935 [Edaphobacter sp.]|nr:hypothetical protein [Edaphobacter sp.]